MSASVDQPDLSAYCSDETLAKVKEQLEQLFEKSRELVDQEDYRSLLRDTDLLRRYVKRKRNQVETSANFIFEALQWRKRHQISIYKENDFPKEFYEFGGLYLHGKDVNGEPFVQTFFSTQKPELIRIFDFFKLSLVGFKSNLLKT